MPSLNGLNALRFRASALPGTAAPGWLRRDARHLIDSDPLSESFGEWVLSFSLGSTEARILPFSVRWLSLCVWSVWWRRHFRSGSSLTVSFSVSPRLSCVRCESASEWSIALPQRFLLMDNTTSPPVGLIVILAALNAGICRKYR